MAHVVLTAKVRSNLQKLYTDSSSTSTSSDSLSLSSTHYNTEKGDNFMHHKRSPISIGIHHPLEDTRP